MIAFSVFEIILFSIILREKESSHSLFRQNKTVYFHLQNYAQKYALYNKEEITEKQIK